MCRSRTTNLEVSVVNLTTILSITTIPDTTTVNTVSRDRDGMTSSKMTSTSEWLALTWL